MEFTLKTARRLEREIGAEVENLTNQISGMQRAHVSIYEDVDAVVQQNEVKLISMAEVSFRLVEIRSKIRKSIETANENEGLNTLMNEEAMLRAKLKVLNQVPSTELTPNELNVVRSKHASLKAAGPQTNSYGGGAQDTVAIQSVLLKPSVDLFKAQAKDIQRRLLKVVDSLTALNTGKMIEINDSDISFLEAHSFVV